MASLTVDTFLSSHSEGINIRDWSNLDCTCLVFHHQCNKQSAIYIDMSLIRGVTSVPKAGLLCRLEQEQLWLCHIQAVVTECMEKCDRRLQSRNEVCGDLREIQQRERRSLWTFSPCQKHIHPKSQCHTSACPQNNAYRAEGKHCCNYYRMIKESLLQEKSRTGRAGLLIMTSWTTEL